MAPRPSPPPIRPGSAIRGVLAALALALPARTEIPPGQALALLGRANPDYPQLSPLLGFLGLRKIMALLFATADYRRKLSAGSASLEAAGLDFRAAAFRILAKAPREGKGQAEAAPQGKLSGYDLLRGRFSDLLQEAVLEEATFEVRRYPPDIVEQALLAYAWKVADGVDELFGAFDGGHLPGILVRPEAGEVLPVMDRTTYEALLPAFMDRLTGPEQNRPSPEERGLFMYGYGCYRTGALDLVTYRTTTYGSDPFPDCGETALHNFFNEVFGMNLGDTPGALSAT